MRTTALLLTLFLLSRPKAAASQNTDLSLPNWTTPDSVWVGPSIDVKSIRKVGRTLYVQVTVGVMRVGHDTGDAYQGPAAVRCAQKAVTYTAHLMAKDYKMLVKPPPAFVDASGKWLSYDKSQLARELIDQLCY